jgi:protein-disulfide isomerase
MSFISQGTTRFLAKTAAKPRMMLDLAVTVLLGTAACTLLWQVAASDGAGESPSRPAAPVEDIHGAKLSTSISGIPTRGSEEAPIVIVEFADFQCPFCARHANETFDAIDREFVSTGFVQYAVRSLPLDNVHRFAIPASQAANCAGDHGAFWEMRAHLYRHQDELANAIWLKNHPSFRVNADQLADCIDRSDLASIGVDRREAVRLGVRSTPTFLVGRRMNRQGDVQLVSRINGALPYTTFRDVLNRMLER